MNFNPNIQNEGVIVWDGTASTPRDVTNHNNFGFSFEATADIAVAALFKFQSAPPSALDKCVPGAFTDILELAICKTPALGAITQVTIPVGTKSGTICAGTIPCKSNKFIRILPVSGDTANVLVVMVRQGPHGA